MIPRRKAEFSGFVGGGNKLACEKPISSSLYFDLVGATANYIAESLNVFNVDDALKLPNRTHNGKIEPKQELLPAFNLIEGLVGKLALELTPYAHSIRHPVNVRVKNGGLNAEDARNYATSKPHTDIWAGDPANTAVIIVPLIGDIEKNGLRFGEPSGILDPEGFESQHETYEQGIETISGVRWYDMPMRAQHAYIVDSWCIHHSQMRGGKRVSLDFRISYGPPSPAAYADLYVPMNDFATKRLDGADTVQQTLEKWSSA